MEISFKILCRPLFARGGSSRALTRDLQGFARFFDATLAGSGSVIDFSKFASKSMIDRNSARRYFDILTDTLIIEPVGAFSKSTKKRLILHPKYYCFDVGVLNTCLNGWSIGPDRIGNLFEHFIVQQIRSLEKSLSVETRLTFYRTENGAEVDLILETDDRIFAVEIKASKNLGHADLRGHKSFRDFFGKSHEALILYLGSEVRLMDHKVTAMPWREGLKKNFSLESS